MKNRGFSLLELLIIIAILGILIVIAIPKYFEVIDEAKRNIQHNNISRVIEAIEIYSIKNGRYPTIDEFKYLLSSSLYFTQSFISPYNQEAYAYTNNFRNTWKYNNFNNAHYIYYTSTSKSYSIWYYPPRYYIGNKNTKIFHYPWCWTLPSPENQVLFKTREEAIGRGYTPCKNCEP